MSDALIQLFAEVLHVDPSKLNDESSPENAKEWDSLAAMELVAAIEEKFNVQLSTKEIMKMSTIGRARKTLQGKGVVV
jgi:acyl carrier protein